LSFNKQCEPCQNPLCLHSRENGFFSADFEGKPRVLEPDKITDWNWFSLDSLPFPLYFPTERMLENYRAKTVHIAHGVIGKA
jgi:hypothetical protein